MMRLFTAVFGRLALILLAQAATAWLIMALINSASNSPATVIGVFITIVVMIITIFMYQEKRLGGNITWLVTLPLAKRSVWFLSYIVRFAAIALALALLCLLAVSTPEFGVPHGRPPLQEVFGALWTSFTSWATFFGLTLPGAPEDPTVGKSMLFVTVAAISHFYCGCIRFMSGRTRILSVVLTFVAGWLSFLVLAAYGSSLFIFEAFMMTAATIISLVIAKETLQISLKNLIPIAAAVVGGWLVLFLPQVVQSMKSLKDPATVDHFVDGYEFFGRFAYPSQERFATAFSRPGTSWQISKLAKIYQRYDGWDEQPGLDPHNDPAFKFLTMVKAQTNYDSAIGVLAIVKVTALTQADIAEFSRYIASLTPARDHNDHIVSRLISLEVSDQQYQDWLTARSPDLQMAALVYPRFYPSQSKWKILSNAYLSGGINRAYFASAFRITAAVVSGAWVSEDQAKELANQDVIVSKVDRGVCNADMRLQMCQAVSNCSAAPAPELESCYLKQGITGGLLNTCLYDMAIKHSTSRDIAQLLEAGWVNPHERYAYVIPRIVCDQGYKD